MRRAWALALLVSAAFAKSRVSGFIERLPVSPPEEQLRLINALGRSKSPRAAVPLLSLFDVRKASPRQSAAIVRALGRLADGSAVEPLMAAWDYLDSLKLRAELPAQLQVLRAEIIEALGAIGDSRADPIVLRALSDEDAAVARRAAEAEGRLKDRKAFEPLSALLTKGGDAAQSAYEALGEMKDERAAASLSRGMGSDDLLVRAEAAYAWARLGRKGGEDALGRIMTAEKKETAAGILAAYYMAKLDRGAGLDYLLAVLRIKDSPLREKAALALGKTGNPRAAQPLSECLKKDEDASLRLLAARALGELGGVRAVFALNRVSNDADPAVRGAAKLALEELGEGD